MSLPGLGAVEVAPVEVASTKYDLKNGTEWRFEVAFDSKIEVRLLSGTAELFGTELATKQVYHFSGTKAAIFTWHGCQIEVVGDCTSEYIAEETPQSSYANLHFALETIREASSASKKYGPRVLVVGPENAGKTTLVKLLAAYAIRAGRQPMVVNLDSRESFLSIPGSLSAASFSSILDIEDGWGSSPTNGPSPIPVKTPLVYFSGVQSVDIKPEMFEALVSRLGLSTLNRFQVDAAARQAGCIVDTAGAMSQGKTNYKFLQHVVLEFCINTIVIIGSERLYSDLLRRYNGQKTSTDEPITVLKVDKSGGCVDRDEAYRSQLSRAQIREYFFGDSKTTLSPHTQQIDFAQMAIYRLKVDDDDQNSSLLPGDYDPDTQGSAASLYQRIEHVTPQMQNGLLAIVQAEVNDTHENIRDASVIGFVVIAEVDEVKQKVKVLAPEGGRLPNKAMIWGHWPEGFEGLLG